jgi:hypothetical protein
MLLHLPYSSLHHTTLTYLNYSTLLPIPTHTRPYPTLPDLPDSGYSTYPYPTRPYTTWLFNSAPAIDRFGIVVGNKMRMVSEIVARACGLAPAIDRFVCMFITTCAWLATSSLVYMALLTLAAIRSNTVSVH